MADYSSHELNPQCPKCGWIGKGMPYASLGTFSYFLQDKCVNCVRERMEHLFAGIPEPEKRIFDESLPTT